LGKFIDLTGQKFGYWTVLYRTNEKSGNEKKWMCRCVCGKEKGVNGSSLRSHSSVSCGCMKWIDRTVSDTMMKNIKKIGFLNKNKVSRRRKEFGESAFNALYAKYISEANKRKKSFLISKEDFMKLVSGNCFYCGVEPNQIKKLNSGYGFFKYNGIDRIDSNIGYEIQNVVPCCKNCNLAKHLMSKKEFLEWVERVYKHSIEDRLKTKGETIND